MKKILSAIFLSLAVAAALPLAAFCKNAENIKNNNAFAFSYLNVFNTKVIESAKKTVDVAMYSITYSDNVNDLISAAKKGVKVRVLMDESHCYPEMNKEIKRLINTEGIQFKTIRGYGDYGVNHNKIVIADKKTVTAGSYNWTFTATFNNFENSVLITDKKTAKGYFDYFEWMWKHARTLEDSKHSETVPQGKYGLPPQAHNIAKFNGADVPAFIFSPGSKSEERLAAILDAAKESIDACTFSFSSEILTNALINAQKRGVKVRFMMDKNLAKNSIAGKNLFTSGTDFKVRIGRKGKGALHDKFVIIDNKILQTGSFNWAKNASENSFENMVFFTGEEYIKAYAKIFDTLYSETETVTEDFFELE
ncbi:MAG: phosphatidylserine/phosphatidylglycerophosphate/cardiolipin synthase family protein [Elusimicrobiales bacterium]|nr:phosphatidylserine/phosphatidylglycerophosphate/cardiolipin synthase family protein [Elusimicrobiales bacterium]